MIRNGSGGQFCPNVVRHFRAVVMPYPVGHEILLPDGRTGVVASVDLDDPDCPTVRVMGPSGVEELTVDMTVARADRLSRSDARRVVAPGGPSRGRRGSGCVSAGCARAAAAL